MKYRVWFDNCEEVVEFEKFEDTKHYACMNAGHIFDTEAGNEVCAFEDEPIIKKRHTDYEDFY